MARQKSYNLHKRKTKLKNEKESTTYYYSINPSSGVFPALCKQEQRKTTGCSTKSAAISHVLVRIEDLKNNSPRKKSELTLKEYAEPFWIWETCPHVDRLRSEENQSQGTMLKSSAL